MRDTLLDRLGTQLRRDIIEMTTSAGSGHVSSSLSAVELMTGLLFSGMFRADLRRIKNPANDRLIFSKGHAAPLLYALYATAGAVPVRTLKNLRAFGSPLEGHPTMRFPYTEVPTGSLGQGLSVALGEALAARLMKSPSRVYCLLGDSEMAEGSVWEAIELAGYYRLENLVGILDLNTLGQSGPTMLGGQAVVMAKRIASFGWETIIVNGHDVDAVIEAYRQAKTHRHPTMIIARTVKGQGVSLIAGREGWHGKVLSPAEARQALRELGAPRQRVIGRIAAPARRTWPKKRRATSKNISYRLGERIAPREALGRGLVRLANTFPNLIVLDGEVKNSSGTESFAQKFPRRFIEGYIAEQNVIGMATGLAARGYVPVSATFAAFWTRAFDQLRMASYSGLHQVVIGTHAGVHIGQDGVSQMGLQDMAMFSTLEHATVLYPADAVAAERLLERGLRHHDIVYLRATRSALPVLYPSSTSFPIGGSKTLRQSADDTATIVAAGVTLHEALRAADILATRKIHVRVIDLYSIKPIDVRTLKQAARQTKHLVVVEDHYADGGIASAVQAALGPLAGTVISLAVRKTPMSGKPEELLSYERIDTAAIIQAIERLRHV
jgi:transketolase